MMRTTLTVIGVVCAATVFTEGFALGLLWFRGQLDSETVSDIATILGGGEPESITVEGDDLIADSEADRRDQVAIERLNLDARDTELALRITMVEEARRRLETDRRAFLKERETFEKRLEDLERLWIAEGTDQARRILQAERPDNAVDQLTALELERAVILVRGLPDKTIAQILQQFAQSNDDEQNQRGREIFEAVTRGEPRTSLVEGAETGAVAPTPTP